MNVTELTSIFSDAFEITFFGGKTLTGLAVLLLLAYIAYRCRISIDAIVVVFVPLIILFAGHGFLPYELRFLVYIIVGVLLGLGIYKAVSG